MEGIALLLVFGLTAALIVGIVLFEAFVLIQLWAWFAVPFFHLPTLNYPVAIGMCTVFTLLCPTPIEPSAPKYDGWERLGVNIFRLLILWGIGSIAHLFM